jgi:tetratricopeptide (TPR) repeat protein
MHSKSFSGSSAASIDALDATGMPGSGQTRLNMAMGVGGWRVFVSHTGELRDYPAAKSYVAEVERAISAAGHVIVDMSDFPAADQPAAQLCAERVRSCEVYVGLLGTRYGSPVRDMPEVSYTEFEFNTATEATMDRLIFMLDTEAPNVGIPLAQLIDREFGDRQDAFRDRVRDSGLVMQSFDSPAKLGQLVERSLRELADTRRRVSSGVDRERVPAEPQPVRASKFINPPPATAPSWFQDRQVETGLVARHLFHPDIRLVIVIGRGGVGKTAMVCRLLKGMEAGRIPDVEGELASVAVGGIVYLSSNGMHQVDYPTLVADLLRLLPDGEARRLERVYQDPHNTPAAVMLAVLEAFPAGEPVVVLLDNLESVMDSERDSLREPALDAALTALLRAPAHRVSVLATTRVTPAALLRVAPAAQRQVPLDQGLTCEDARIVLSELDDDGRLGLRGAPEELLDRLCEHTRGFPRALEAVKAILDGDPSLTPRDLLDRTRDLPEDQVVEELVGEAYRLLDPPAQQVMQALSVFPDQVTAVGVDFLLQPANPTTNAAPILTRLLRRQLVRFHDGHYHLHPIDRKYARTQLPPGHPGDTATTFTLAGLGVRAADYFATIRTQRESWRTLDDIQPQLAEFKLRCDTGDYDTAATVLEGIDFEYMQRWGHYRTLVELHGQIDGHISDPTLNADHFNSLGLSHHVLGNYRQAMILHTQALDIYRDIGDRESEAAALTNIGRGYDSLDDYRQAINLHTQALDIYRETGDLDGQATALGNLGVCHYMLGDYRRAIELHTQALGIRRDTGDLDGQAVDLGNLGICQDGLGDYRQAINLYTQALGIYRDIGDRDGEAAVLGNLGFCHYRLGDYRQAIDLHTQALGIDQDTGNRDYEAAALTNIGRCHYMLGDYWQAISLCNRSLTIAGEIGSRHREANVLDCLGRAWLASGDMGQALSLLNQAVTIAESTGDIEPAVEARSGLARTNLQLDDPQAALTLADAALQRPYPTEQPTLLLLKGIALLQLGQTTDGVQAFEAASGAAEALLELHDRNVAALYAQALALCGLAVAATDPDRAGDAANAFTRARAVTTAAGVTTASLQLLDQIRRSDQAGILTELRAAHAL